MNQKAFWGRSSRAGKAVHKGDLGLGGLFGKAGERRGFFSFGGGRRAGKGSERLENVGEWSGGK